MNSYLIFLIGVSLEQKNSNFMHKWVAPTSIIFIIFILVNDIISNIQSPINEEKKDNETSVITVRSLIFNRKI